MILGSRGFFGKNFVSKYACNNICYNDSLDLNNLEELESFIEESKPDVIVNCAGVVGSSIGNNNHVDIFERNNRITHNVFSACLKFNVNLVVFSTSRVFGQLSDYDEKDIHLSEIKNNFGYLLSKKILDYYVKMYSEHVRILCLFLTNVYGEFDTFEEYSKVVPASIYKIGIGQRFHASCNPETQINLCYIDDVVNSVNYCVANNIYGNLFMFDSTLTIKQLHDLIMAEMKKEVDITYDNFKELVQINPPKKSFRLPNSTTIEQGLRKTINYYKETFACGDTI